MKKLALYLLLSDSGQTPGVKGLFACDSYRYTKLMFDCAPPFALFKKKFKDAPINTATLKSFRGIITVGVITVLTTN